MVGFATLLEWMATVQKRLGRVRFTDRDQWGIIISEEIVVIRRHAIHSFFDRHSPESRLTGSRSRARLVI